MKKYNNLENPEFTQEIDIFEVTDPAHANVLNIPVKQIYENTMVNQQTKVDKEEGKSLSDNNYSDEEKDKLAAIETGAQRNTVLGVKGSAEVEYKTGNVNLTPGNIGAAAKYHLHEEYAEVSHNHNDDYALKTHNHSNYAAVNHNHNDDYALRAHNHSNYAAVDHNHSNYASADHNHQETYAPIDHKHGSDYASANHTHTLLSMGIRSGTTPPQSLLGNNGDIYFQYIL